MRDYTSCNIGNIAIYTRLWVVTLMSVNYCRIYSAQRRYIKVYDQQNSRYIIVWRAFIQAFDASLQEFCFSDFRSGLWTALEISSIPHFSIHIQKLPTTIYRNKQQLSFVYYIFVVYLLSGQSEPQKSFLGAACGSESCGWESLVYRLSTIPSSQPIEF